MKLTFIRADHEVTGSCTLLEIGGHYGLIDCGMEQGRDLFENIAIPVPAAQIEFVLVTHAHMDHTGHLPLLYKQGFRGTVYATKASVLAPMRQIQIRSIQNKEELVKYRHTPKFAPAGQSTQMIVGATPDSDLHILRLTQGLYDRYQLKRVFFSAYVPVVESALLPSKETKPPLLREHRLYQADWLLRFYGFRAEELLDEQIPSFDPRLDPKCCWALRHPDFFPVEVNRADYEALLRVPGLGVVSARRILTARRAGPLRLENLPKLGVVMKRAQYFLTANGRMADGLRFTQDSLLRNLIAVEQSLLPQPEMRQLSLFDDAV